MRTIHWKNGNKTNQTASENRMAEMFWGFGNNLDPIKGFKGISVELSNNCIPKNLHKLNLIEFKIQGYISLYPGPRQQYKSSIPKLAKDHTDRNSYRPLALTSCISKIMERINKNNLVCSLKLT